MPEAVDRLFVHAKEMVPLTAGSPRGARRGEAMRTVDVVTDGAIAVRDGRIVAAGPTDAITAAYVAEDVLDLTDTVVLPGFVDCHTHPVFAATREREFHMRCAGADYMAIASAGGGILSSVRSLRAMDEDALVARVDQNLDKFLANGTTTIEAKSGYGLDVENEVKSLRALTRAMEDHPLTVHRTFLGAHEVPLEYRDRRDAFVALVVDQMLPAVDGLCESCDVFAEPGVFDLEQSRRVLSAAKARGLRLRVHADEIQPMGGAELAVELGADSADHLAVVSEAGVQALASSATMAVLLPGTSFLLGKHRHAPARAMLDAGCAVALASDFNPGSCYAMSMPLIVTLACVLLHMTPAECLCATTINPAASLGLDGEVGTLHPGKRADFVALDLPSFEGLGYVFGGNPVLLTVKDGEVYGV